MKEGQAVGGVGVREPTRGVPHKGRDNEDCPGNILAPEVGLVGPRGAAVRWMKSTAQDVGSGGGGGGDSRDLGVEAADGGACGVGKAGTCGRGLAGSCAAGRRCAEGAKCSAAIEVAVGVHPESWLRSAAGWGAGRRE